jgi:predicted nucleic acid-binding protein
LNAVIDASAAVDIALDGRHAKDLRRNLETADLVMVPDVFAPEVANAFGKYHRFAQMEPATCFHALDLALALFDVFVSNRELAPEALSLSIGAKMPVYDMFYLALARREGAVLLTLDAKLREIAARHPSY